MAGLFLSLKALKPWLSTPKEQSTVKKVTDAAKSLMADKIARQKERGFRLKPFGP